MRRISVLSLALLFVGTAVALAALTVPLVYDSSGTNDGVGYGGILGKVGATANTASSYGFDGAVGTFVQIDNATSLLPAELTLSVWVNPTSLSSCNGGTCAVVGNEGVGSEEYGFGLRLNPGSNDFASVQWCIGAVAGVGGCAYAAPGLVPENDWTHIVTTYDSASGKAIIYVNGEEASPAPHDQHHFNPVWIPDAPSFTTSQPLYIGKLTDPGDGFEFKGSIDDVRIYNRVLDPSEIDGANMPNDDGLIGWWKLDELPIQTVVDIKPGNDPNSINARSNGVVPAAILGAGDFDVTRVDAASVTLGGAFKAHDNAPMGHLEDVNHDGHTDMMLHFRTQEIELDCDATELTLEGQLLDGTPIIGTDSIAIEGKCK